MLPSKKIQGSFSAICEEVEKLQKLELPENIQEGLKNIWLIAKHQSDVRGAQGNHGGCTARKGCSR
ncbi:MAG: hypothetical protein CSA31_01440 [Desulfobulbus propionicus]|nr:MAG: hypothetical protein CSA31_01440 [Desulfobulbus propionicus]